MADTELPKLTAPAAEVELMFDTGIRLATEQIIIRSQNTVLDRPDIENQDFADDTDNLGNSKTALGAPVNGISVITQQCELYKPYFSQLTKSVDIDSASDNCTITDPRIFASGTQQTVLMSFFYPGI